MKRATFYLVAIIAILCGVIAPISGVIAGFTSAAGNDNDGYLALMLMAVVVCGVTWTMSSILHDKDWDSHDLPYKKRRELDKRRSALEFQRQLDELEKEYEKGAGLEPTQKPELDSWDF